MSVLLVAAAVSAAASAVVTGCVAYILISFWRSGHLMASRIGHGALALVVVTPDQSRRHRIPTARAIGVRRPLRAALVH